MKQASLESHIRRLALSWAIAGILLTLAFSGGLFHWLRFQDARNRTEALASAALTSYRTDILSGGVRSIELQLRRDFLFSQDERLFFLDSEKLPWLSGQVRNDLHPCVDPSGICRNFWNGMVVVEKPIYFDDEGKQLWGYLHIEVNPKTDWSLVLTVTLILAFGMLVQNFGLYFSLSKAIGAVSSTISNWARKLSQNPKNVTEYITAPFDEMTPIETALAGLKGEIDSLENVARQQGALTTLRGVGHDILNPVARMKRIVGLLQIESKQNSENELLLSLNANLKRLSSYAEQLKYIYKQQSGESVASAPSLDLSKELMAISKELAFDADVISKNIALKVDVDPACHAQIPSAAFGRIVENLCGNSVQASALNSTVALQISRIDKGTRVSVRDQGCGISSAAQLRIFEPGYTTKTNKGTGLGLFVVKQICDQFQAEISFESEVGKGTCINIDFPNAEVNCGV